MNAGSSGLRLQKSCLRAALYSASVCKRDDGFRITFRICRGDRPY